MSDVESDWLIEIRDERGRPLWWTGPGGCWTVDVERAAHYQRKSDAERVILHSGHEGAVATEHQRVPPSAPPSKSWRTG